jgi:hypothetical protein
MQANHSGRRISIFMQAATFVFSNDRRKSAISFMDRSTEN